MFISSHLPVFVEVQAPQVCLISSHVVFTEIYTGVPAKATSKLFNQRLLPAKYLWGKVNALLMDEVYSRDGNRNFYQNTNNDYS